MPRILLVDDDRSVLRSLGRVIHFMPVSVLHGEAMIESFEDPLLALERVAQIEFDLVIADYLMPKMLGVHAPIERVALARAAVDVERACARAGTYRCDQGAWGARADGQAVG